MLGSMTPLGDIGSSGGAKARRTIDGTDPPRAAGIPKATTP
jgi:hypothetical protein